MAASVDGGATASVLLYKSGNKVVRSFQPDFILVRQNVKDGPQEDYKNILLGFQYGNVPSVNSLESIYNFQASDMRTGPYSCHFCPKMGFKMHKRRLFPIKSLILFRAKVPSGPCIRQEE